MTEDSRRKENKRAKVIRNLHCKGLLTGLGAICITLALVCLLPTETIRVRERAPLVIIFSLLALIAFLGRAYVSEANMMARKWIVKQTPGNLARRESVTVYRRFLEETARSRFTPEQIAGLINLLSDPAVHLSRVTTSVEIHSTHSRNAVHRVIGRVGQSVPDLFPVLRQRKGVLLDRLMVTISGQRVSTLSYVEGQGLTLVLLHALFTRCFPSANVEDEDSSHAQCLLRLKESAIADAPADLAEVAEILGELQELTDRATGGHSSTLWAALMDLARCIPAHYFVYVSISEKERGPVRLGVEYDSRVRWQRQGARDLLRAFIGLTRRSLLLPLTHATEAPSYHVNVTVPSGLYVLKADYVLVGAAESSFTGSPDALPVAAASSSNRPRMPALVQGRLGRDHWHGYIRDVDGYTESLEPKGHGTPSDTSLFLEMELRERPPGLVAVVTILAAYLCALTWSVGHYYTKVFPPAPGLLELLLNKVTSLGTPTESEPVSGAPTSAPTVLFGIPAILSAWIVTRFTPRTLSRVSLTTIALTGWVLLNAAIAVAITAFKTSGVTVTTDATVAGINPTFIAWATLQFSTALALVFCIVFLVMRFGRYRKALAIVDTE
jgi:hypothetical protein